MQTNSNKGLGYDPTNCSHSCNCPHILISYDFGIPLRMPSLQCLWLLRQSYTFSGSIKPCVNFPVLPKLFHKFAWHKPKPVLWNTRYCSTISPKLHLMARKFNESKLNTLKCGFKKAATVLSSSNIWNIMELNIKMSPFARAMKFICLKTSINQCLFDPYLDEWQIGAFTFNNFLVPFFPHSIWNCKGLHLSHNSLDFKGAQNLSRWLWVSPWHENMVKENRPTILIKEQISQIHWPKPKTKQAWRQIPKFSGQILWVIKQMGTDHHPWLQQKVLSLGASTIPTLV